VTLFTAKKENHNTVPDEAIQHWNLIPSSIAKSYPVTIPEMLRKDYEEACKIKDLSPKASATLSRRVLQGIMRDFYQAKGRNLSQEIDNVQDKFSKDILEAMHAVREMGNIGAHMEKDINLIIDIDPGESEVLISLIEILFQKTYIAKEEQEETIAKIKAINDNKQKQRKLNPTP
jgi:hypothetical protein